MITHESLKGTKFWWPYCSLFCFFFFFYRYGKRMKRKSAVVNHDSFTLISVVHYNCVPSSSAPSLWKQIILFREDSSLNFNTDIWHVFKTELLQQGEAGKHYVIILRTSERLLFPRHKRYSNEAKTNYGELGSCFAKCVFFFLRKKKGKVMQELSLSVMLWVPSLGGKGCLSSLEDSVFQVRVSDVSWVRTSRITTKGKASKNKPTSTLPHPRPHLTRLLPLGIVDILFIV